jgi:hypothetical protein
MTAPTNTVLAPLPDGMEITAARVAFESFGEVSTIRVAPGNSGIVQVVFYDIRSAARCLKAFGPAGCVAGAAIGNRSVELAGENELSMKDFSRISDVKKKADGKSFVLEFFDLRDAARYREEAEAELSKPPGLEMIESTKPELAEDVNEEPEWQVIIRGIPVKLQTEVMLEAVFQQARLNYLSFEVQPGGQPIKVVVRFADLFRAQCCVMHFQGCVWDKSGETVFAAIVPPASHSMFQPTTMCPRPLPDKVQSKSNAFLSTTAAMQFQSHEACFEPFSPKADDSTTTSRTSTTGLSAEAPAFVPNSLLTEVFPKKGTRARKPTVKGISAGSDTSTEVGSSEEDEIAALVQAALVIR